MAGKVHPNEGSSDLQPADDMHTISITPPATPAPPSGYFKALIALGAVLLFCAIANLALGIANAVICGLFGSIGYGIWGAVICLAAGISGIVAGSTKARASIILCLTLSVIAAVSSTVQLAMGAGSAVVDHVLFKHLYNVNTPYDKVTTNYSASSSFDFFDKYGCDQRQRDMYSTRWTGPVATDALLACFAVIQGIAAIIVAAYSCRASFCPPGVTEMPWQLYGSHIRLVPSTSDKP